ncbi:hypothetical protein GCM10009835_24890 [Planosporangium flavigriseum]
MVLSTSKNAAAPGSAGTVSAASTSAAAQPESGSTSFVDAAPARDFRRLWIRLAILAPLSDIPAAPSGRLK